MLPACDAGRTLYEYLLDGLKVEPGEDGPAIDFLGFDDPVPPRAALAATVPSVRLQGWLDRQPGTGIDDLLMCVPLSHRIVTRELVKAWAGHLVQVTSTLDLRRLIAAMLRAAKVLPARLVAELKRYRTLLARGDDPVANLTTWGWRFFSVLMLVLVLSQTAMPTAAYAKGFSGGGYSRAYGREFHEPARAVESTEKHSEWCCLGVGWSCSELPSTCRRSERNNSSMPGPLRGVRITEDRRDAWESAVRANPACGFMQSLTWAEFQARQGVAVFPRLGPRRPD